MEPRKNKKDSLFSSIFPAPEQAAPAPAAVPPPPPAAARKPAVTEEQAAGIAKRIDSLEKSIVERIEKHLASAPVPAASVADPETASRLAAVEQALKEFQEKVVMGAAQMKNIEESKISARREIEELLKVVREQQKYSELDRQMHEQLEKAWARVEEMEKRLVEAYAAAAKRPEEAPVPQLRPDELPGLVSGAVGDLVSKRLDALAAAIEQRIKPLEDSIGAQGRELKTIPGKMRTVEDAVRDSLLTLETRISGISEEIGQISVRAFAGKERLEDIAADIKAEITATVREGSERGHAAALAHIDSSALDGVTRLDTLAATMGGRLDSMLSAQAEAVRKMEALEGRIIGASAETEARLEKALAERLESVAAELRDSARGKVNAMAEMGRISSGVASSLAVASSAAGDMEESLKSLLEDTRNICVNFSSVNLDALLGVSGALIRRNLLSIEALLPRLEKHLSLVSSKKIEILTAMRKLESEWGDLK